MTIRRLMPLACAALDWSSIVLAPSALTAQPEAHGAANPHQDLRCLPHSENCVACHNNLVTPAGEDVSIGATWRSTMMANSARDPYWQAAVRRETIDHPSTQRRFRTNARRATCRCHKIAQAPGGSGEVFAHLP